MRAIIIMVTAPNRKEADKIGRALLERRLIACVNIVSGVDSLFRWQGKIDSAGEVLMIMKSTRPMLRRVILAVKSLHSYKVPEVIAVNVAGGSAEYLEWIDGSVRKPV